jgi:hypothetical protein
VLRTLPEESLKLLLGRSISPLPLHKVLVLRDRLRTDADRRYLDHELLALAKVAVAYASNLHFGPEVGVGPAKDDAPVVGPWLAEVGAMAGDLRALGHHAHVPCRVVQSDSRNIQSAVEPASIDAVVTSPPYPNEKDYTRTTRLESVLLGFLRSRSELRASKKCLMRSNTRNVYKEDDDDQYVAGNTAIQDIAREIEARRVAMGKTSGFERLYARVTKLYFGGMARHLSDLREALRPGANLAYVVGDQASYLRVMIPTGRILAEIAQSLGYELLAVDLFRTRRATATRQDLREEVVVLRWACPAGGRDRGRSGRLPWSLPNLRKGASRDRMPLKGIAVKINQLSVFLENKPGRISEPCKLLAKAGINIVTLSLADTQQFGILRLILPEWRKARSVLEEAGCVVNVTEVVATEVEDRPGGLAEVLEIIEKAGINIEYMYAFTFRRQDKAVLVFRFDDPEGALKALQSKGVSILCSVELSGLAGGQK